MEVAIQSILVSDFAFLLLLNISISVFCSSIRFTQYLSLSDYLAIIYYYSLLYSASFIFQGVFTHFLFLFFPNTDSQSLNDQRLSFLRYFVESAVKISF